MGLWRRVTNVVLLTVIAFTFTNTFGTLARVDGISMQPTLNPNNTGDIVFLSYLSAHLGWINRGDVVVAISPRNQKHIIIKRVIGVEGDVIVLEASRSHKSGMKIVVPTGCYWIEGDHKGYTYDSTSFGPISKEFIIAKVQAIVWPPSRWQLIKSEFHK